MSCAIWDGGGTRPVGWPVRMCIRVGVLAALATVSLLPRGAWAVGLLLVDDVDGLPLRIQHAGACRLLAHGKQGVRCFARCKLVNSQNGRSVNKPVRTV